jgi:hypothetical protein
MRRLLPLAIATVALTLSCRAGWRNRTEDRDEILSAHGPHIRAGISCLECHADAVVLKTVSGDDSRHGARPLLPSEARCKSCHDERPEEQQCSFCHRRPERPASYPAHDAELVFDHSTHIERSQGLCIRCHAGGQATAEAFQPRRSPPMSDCTSACHSHTGDMRGMECSRCHRDLHRYGVAQLAIIRHRPGFAQQHGTAARVDRELCAQCHDATHCADCHQAAPGLAPEVVDPVQVARDFVHRGDFLARHGTEARVAQGTCTRCHGISFCDGCHRESGIGGSVAAGSPHEPGWLDPMSSRSHVRAARRDILSCAACHESNAEAVCVPCHRVGGLAAVNPHPPRFGQGLEPLDHGVCRVCHAGAP